MERPDTSAEDKAAEDWSEKAAASAVDELIVAGILVEPEKNADWARRIVAQDLFIGWVSGGRLQPPPPEWLTRKP